MKTWKIFPGIFMAVVLLAGFIPAAQAALVTREYQVFQLGGSSPPGDNSGILSFTKLNLLLPDGTQVPIGTLPTNANVKLVITYININFHTVNSDPINADLRMGPFFSKAMTVNNNSLGYAETFDPGIVISPLGFNNNNFYASNLQTGDIVQGNINVRLLGYLVPIQ